MLLRNPADAPAILNGMVLLVLLLQTAQTARNSASLPLLVSVPSELFGMVLIVQESPDVQVAKS